MRLCVLGAKRRHTHTHTGKHTHTHIHTGKHAHTHRGKHTHTLSLTHTLTHTHTHSLSPRLSPSPVGAVSGEKRFGLEPRPRARIRRCSCAFDRPRGEARVFAGLCSDSGGDSLIAVPGSRVAVLLSKSNTERSAPDVPVRCPSCCWCWCWCCWCCWCCCCCCCCCWGESSCAGTVCCSLDRHRGFESGRLGDPAMVLWWRRSSACLCLRGDANPSLGCVLFMPSSLPALRLLAKVLVVAVVLCV